MAPGFALDLTVIDPDDGMPWDFEIKGKRDKARRILREQRPYLLIGSPECRAFSSWQNLNRFRSANPEAMERDRIAAAVHLEFVASLYREQHDADRFFLHEHPWSASSWELSYMRSILSMPSVQKIRGDQCQYGARADNG